MKHPSHRQRTRLNTAWHATLLGMSLSGLAQAQQADAASPADQPLALPGVTVRGTKPAETATGPVNGYIARRSATATKTDTPVNEVAQSISVITADQVRDQGARSIDEALQYTPGVRTTGNDNRTESFSLRGGSQGAYTLLDGLRQPRSGYGVVRDVPYAYERMEVLRGPASVIAGQNGPGGVLNLVSKRPQAQASREVGIALGTHGQKELSADLTGPLAQDGRLLYRLVVHAEDSHTQVDHADKTGQYIAPSITFLPMAGTRLTAYAEYLHQKSGNTTGFLPKEGTLTPGPYGYLPTSTFIGQPGWDTFGGKRMRVGWEWAQTLSDDWTLRHHLRHDEVDGRYQTHVVQYWLRPGFGLSSDYFDANGTPDPTGRYLARRWDVSHDRGSVTNADLTVEGKLRTGAAQHTLLAGLDVMTHRVHQTEWGNVGSDLDLLDVYAPNYANWTPPNLADFTPDPDSHSSTRQIGILLQDQIKVDERWVLTAGIRQDKVRLRSHDDVNQRQSNTDASGFTKNLGLVHLADGGWSPYVSYSESFETQGVDPQGGFFAPRRGQQTEAGVKWLSADGRFSASAAVFRLKEKNRLQADENDPFKQILSAPVTVKGLELEGRARLKALNLIGAYTLQSGRDNESHTNLAGLPNQQWSLWAAYDFRAFGLPGLKAGLGARYIGASHDGGDIDTVPSVTLADAMVAWDHGDWRLALNVRNLADKTYLSACSYANYCVYGARRQATASATYRF